MILRNHSRRPRGMIAALLAGVLAYAVAGQDAEKKLVTPAQTEPSREAPRVEDEKLDQILTRLEGRKITDLRSKVRWDVEDVIVGDKASKFGTLLYLDREPVAKFKVEFTEKLEGQRKDKLDEQHLFDGRWYVELNAIAKSVTRREVRAAGDKRNPFKLGEGAFPLPFGQKKADILRDFEVARIEKDEKDNPPDTDHIKLVPKPGTSTFEQYRAIEFWIARENSKLSGLPVKVKAAKKGGTGQVNSNIYVTFNDVDLSAAISDAIFKIETPAGFHEQVEPLAPVPANKKIEDIKIEDMKPAE